MNIKIKILQLKSLTKHLQNVKTEVDDETNDAIDTTYSASKIEERLAESAGGFLGSYTSSTRPSLVTADAGKYIYLTDTQAWIFWDGSKWSDQ